MLYIFIDTNIVMHYKPVTEIDWLALTKSTECTIVLAPVVQDELEVKKRGHSKTAQRVQAFIKMIAARYKKDNKILENVSFEIPWKKPNKAFVESQDLVFEENDQKLLASMIDFKTSIDSTDDIMYCTSDVFASFRAEQRNIQTLSLPERYKVTTDLSDEEKEIQKLRRENEQLKNQIPEIFLVSVDGQSFLSIERKAGPNYTCEDHTISRMQQLRDRHPLLEFPQQGGYVGNMSYRKPLSPSEIVAYNRELETFYKEHLEIFRQEYELIRDERLYYTLNLVLSVGGSAPAKSVEVVLNFPSGLWWKWPRRSKQKKLSIHLHHINPNGPGIIRKLFTVLNLVS